MRANTDSAQKHNVKTLVRYSLGNADLNNLLPISVLSLLQVLILKFSLKLFSSGSGGNRGQGNNRAW